jgi:hypothetical protein
MLLFTGVLFFFFGLEKPSQRVPFEIFKHGSGQIDFTILRAPASADSIVIYE